MRLCCPANPPKGNTRWKPFLSYDHLRTYRPRHEQPSDYNNDSRKLRITEAVPRCGETAEKLERR